MVESRMHVALLFAIPIEPRATAPSRSLDLPGPAALGERRRELSPNAPRWFKNKSDKPVPCSACARVAGEVVVSVGEPIESRTARPPKLSKLEQAERGQQQRHSRPSIEPSC